MSYLFGSILAVPTSDLIIMLVLNVIIIALTAAFYKELQAISFDETFAFVVNVPVDRLYLMLVSLIAITVVMTMRVVGLDHGHCPAHHARGNCRIVRQRYETHDGAFCRIECSVHLYRA